MESLGVVYRRGKNYYYWIGLHGIKDTIEKISLSNFTIDQDYTKGKEKSLGFLAIGFIKLFIHWKPIISLEQAAFKLTLGEEIHKLKTKVRRLYDIANVFLALGIIKKAYLQTRKPAFSWVGLEG